MIQKLQPNVPGSVRYETVFFMNNEPTYQKTARAPGHYYEVGWFLCEHYGWPCRNGTESPTNLVGLRPLDRRHAGLPDHRYAGDGWRGNVLVSPGPRRRPAPSGPDP